MTSSVALVQNKIAFARSIFRRCVSSCGLCAHDLAIDLGTANTVVYRQGAGVVLSEPSVVALDLVTNEVIAFGQAAKVMLGKTPRRIRVIRPMRDGVIADFEMAELFLRFVIRASRPKNSIFKPMVLIAVPTGISDVEKRAVTDSGMRAGAKQVILIEEPVAAAIGVDLPLHESSATMIVDIGGGTTEIAILASGDIVVAQSVRIGGDRLDQAIIDYLRTAHNLVVGIRTAENIKITIGSVSPLFGEEGSMEVCGFDHLLGLPVTRVISSQEIRDALLDTFQQIVEAIRQTLEYAPPELAADLITRGMTLAGGTAQLQGLAAALEKAIGLPVKIAKEPLLAVCRGTGKALEYLKQFHR